jgi:hypothetical protein
MACLWSTSSRRPPVPTDDGRPVARKRGQHSGSQRFVPVMPDEEDSNRLSTSPNQAAIGRREAILLL